MENFNRNGQYNVLEDFLLSFLLATYDQFSDVEAINLYVTERDRDRIQTVLKKGRELLSLDPFPWKWVSDLINGIPCDPEEEALYTIEEHAKRWTRSVMAALELEAKRQGKL